ncbi:hypothetical protein DSO57_1032213 [Entomophthora muscae]|uniref:Uncharacterized protein n=1 Tax=Entomophthora muscae TaxID=34485 RepID=A0ACC2T1A7_9FUNG|nr:hypothetical protein DSO57_1032213 [Entomophthora muscae]
MDSPPHIASLNDSLNASGPVSSLEKGSTDFFNSLVSAIRQPDSGISPGDVILVPLAISHETGLDMRHVTSQWGENVTTQRIARIAGDACKGRIHVAFGNAMELGGLVDQVDQILQLGMDDPSLTNPCHIVRSRQIQCQIVSPVSLTAMILSRYRIHGISFDYARTLLVKLRDEALGLGYNIDWQAGEDSTAILSYCLEAIGPNHVTVEMGNDDGDFSGPTPAQVQRIMPKKDESTAMRIRALVGQAQHMFLFVGLFMAAYCHCNEQAAATGMGLPTLEDIRAIYDYLATLMAPHHPEISVLSTQNSFKAIVARLEKDDIIQLMDTDQTTLVILNNDRLHQDYLYTAQALLYPTLNSYWATCCALALLPSLHDIQVSKFVSLIQENIREACAKSFGCHPEAAAAPTIYNALTCFSQMGLINIHTPTDDSNQEPRLSVSTQGEHERLKNHLATWCPVPTAHGGHHIDQFLSKGSNDQHRAFLECVEQVGFSIELFRSESPSQLAMVGPSLKQDDLLPLPQFLPPPYPPPSSLQYPTLVSVPHP